MKYTATKRRYIDSIFILLIGIACVAGLGLYIKPSILKTNPPSKPVISVTATNRFLYVANQNATSAATIFHTNTSQNEYIYSTTSGEITNASLQFNRMLYLHGNENTGINITVKKPFFNNGDFISPDGKKFISLGTTEKYPDLLTFSLLDGNSRSQIQTQNAKSQIDKILGWSPDSINFYYTIPYSITKQASMSATDHWMQKFGKEMKPMSRVRTWVVYSTKSAISVFKLDTENKNITKLFTDTNVGTIFNAFYDAFQDKFYLVNDSGIYAMHPSDTNAVQIPLLQKNALKISSMIFSQDPHRFVHSDGTAIQITDLSNNTDRTIFYASQSAKAEPLVYTGSSLIFSLLDTHFISGELVDTKRLVRTEFYHASNNTITHIMHPLLFVSWLKDITVSF